AESESSESTRKSRTNRSGDATQDYKVDIESSRVYVLVGSATRLGHRHGVEGRLQSGSISLGAGGELVFDMKSFQAGTKEAGNKVGLGSLKISANEAKKVNAAMHGADVLDVEKFPTATYKLILIEAAEKQEAGAPGAYSVDGRFKLHGTEQPL